MVDLRLMTICAAFVWAGCQTSPETPPAHTPGADPGTRKVVVPLHRDSVISIVTPGQLLPYPKSLIMDSATEGPPYPIVYNHIR